MSFCSDFSMTMVCLSYKTSSIPTKCTFQDQKSDLRSNCKKHWSGCFMASFFCKGPISSEYKV